MPHRLHLVLFPDLPFKQMRLRTQGTFHLTAAWIAQLHRPRCEVEKVFDEFQNKLGEKQAWASSPAAMTLQATLLRLTHNLLRWFQELVINPRSGCPILHGKPVDAFEMTNIDRGQNQAVSLGGGCNKKVEIRCRKTFPSASHLHFGERPRDRAVHRQNPKPIAQQLPIKGAESRRLFQRESIQNLSLANN